MAERDNPFSAKTILWVIAAGVIAFAGFLVLLAYAPEWRARGDNGAHVLSKSAVGFSGLYDLARFSGRPANVHTRSDGWGYTGLYIVTIQPDSDAKLLGELVAAQRATEGSTTLYILPKWQTMPLATNKRWVQSSGLIDGGMLKPLLDLFGPIAIASAGGRGGAIRGAPDGDMEGIVAPRPKQLQHIVGGLDPVLEDGEGHMVLGKRAHEGGGTDYVLADPDLLSNQGLKSADGADAAIRIVDALRFGPEDSVAFDMVLVTGADNRNLLRLMFEPPFLAFTLALLVAAILAGYHAAVRFGPPILEGRAIPFGKRALADNAATLIARAGRENRLGDRYVAVVRDDVAAALGAQTLSAEALERWLAKLPGDFAGLAEAARGARDATAMRVAAHNLYLWKKDVTRDHR